MGRKRKSKKEPLPGNLHYPENSALVIKGGKNHHCKSQIYHPLCKNQWNHTRCWFCFIVFTYLKGEENLIIYLNTCKASQYYFRKSVLFLIPTKTQFQQPRVLTIHLPTSMSHFWGGGGGRRKHENTQDSTLPLQSLSSTDFFIQKYFTKPTWKCNDGFFSQIFFSTALATVFFFKRQHMFTQPKETYKKNSGLPWLFNMSAIIIFETLESLNTFTEMLQVEILSSWFKDFLSLQALQYSTLGPDYDFI